MLESLRICRMRYRKEPTAHLLFLLVFIVFYGLSYFKIEGFVIPIFIMKLLTFLISVSAIAAVYYYFIKRSRKEMIRDICDDNGKPYAFDPESIECVEDLTGESGKPTVAVTMKSGKTVVLNVSAAKFITKFKAK